MNGAGLSQRAHKNHRIAHVRSMRTDGLTATAQHLAWLCRLQNSGCAAGRPCNDNNMELEEPCDTTANFSEVDESHLTADLTAEGDAQINPSSPWPMLYDEYISPPSPSGDVGLSRSLGRDRGGERNGSGEPNLELSDCLHGALLSSLLDMLL